MHESVWYVENHDFLHLYHIFEWMNQLKWWLAWNLNRERERERWLHGLFDRDRLFLNVFTQHSGMHSAIIGKWRQWKTAIEQRSTQMNAKNEKLDDTKLTIHQEHRSISCLISSNLFFHAEFIKYQLEKWVFFLAIKRDRIQINLREKIYRLPCAGGAGTSARAKHSHQSMNKFGLCSISPCIKKYRCHQRMTYFSMW